MPCRYTDLGRAWVAFVGPGNEISRQPAAEYDAAIREGPDVSLCYTERGVEDC
jgi:hypothetical protein